jgi:hypothetical protein
MSNNNCDECKTHTVSPYYINNEIKLCTDCYVRHYNAEEANNNIELASSDDYQDFFESI